MRGAERWSWKQLPGAGQVLASGDLGQGAGTHGQHVVRSRVCAGRRAGFSRCGAVMTQGLCGGAAAGAVSRSPAPQPPWPGTRRASPLARLHAAGDWKMVQLETRMRTDKRRGPAAAAAAGGRGRGWGTGLEASPARGRQLLPGGASRADSWKRSRHSINCVD